MDWRQLSGVFSGLQALGKQRLIALAVAGAAVFGLITLGSFYGTRASFETLYVGLTPQDVSRMGAVLSEAGIPFEASQDGTKIGVPMAQVAQARAMLAEKGLPGSPTAGYELFDKLGALGLTSFMQQVTRVRALEGELARTIQNLKGVKAARVHLALPDPNTLKSKRPAPSASVIIRTDGVAEPGVARAIKHLVSAAIPEMGPDQISIVGTDGQLLAGATDASSETSSKMIDLEQQVARQIQENVARTLSPYLGLGNFEVSAVARLNIDKIQSSETAYDPDKRVERSTRVVKENESSQDSAGRGTVGVDQNIPNEAGSDGGKDQNKRAQDRREETTNYEVSSKSSSVVSEGYRISNLSVAIVVNRKRFGEIAGKELGEEDIKKQVGEIERLVQSAAGIDSKRGDKIDVAAFDFASEPVVGMTDETSAWAPMLFSLLGVFIKSVAVVAVAAIVVFAGLRPALRTIMAGSPGAASIGALGAPAIAGMPGNGPTLEIPEMASPLLELDNPFAGPLDSSNFGLGLPRGIPNGPVERLVGIFEREEEQATAVLKHWVRGG